MLNCYTQKSKSSIEITPVITAEYEGWLESQDAFTQRFLVGQNFAANSSSVVKVPNSDGEIARVVLGVKNKADYWAYGKPRC